MFEIRSRMAPDVKDLKKHTEPPVLAKQAGQKIKDRIRGAATKFGKSLADSAHRQFQMASEAGKKRDPAPFTDAVKSDPRPLILLAIFLAIFLAVSLLTVRRISNGRSNDN